MQLFFVMCTLEAQSLWPLLCLCEPGCPTKCTATFHVSMNFFIFNPLHFVHVFNVVMAKLCKTPVLPFAQARWIL